MSDQAAQDLRDTIYRSDATDDDLWASAEALRAAASTPADRDAALHTLIGDLDLDDAPLSGFVALVCGALVEDGGDPAVLVGPLTARLTTILGDAAEICQVCQERMPPEDEQDDDFEFDDVFEDTLTQLADEMPDQHDAWLALDLFWRPAIGVYINGIEARRAARALAEPAGQIAEFHEGARWLWMITSVLEDEPFLVLEPSTLKGLAGQISGVSDNFQLNTLLMATFPPRSLVPARVAAVAQGDGPQHTDDVIVGPWNLYSWRAAEPEGLYVEDHEHWIWNEGLPADIPAFEGHRVVLLGPASYERRWSSQRTFEKLPARLDLDRRLEKEEVRDWLRRMVQAVTSEEG